MFCPFSFGMIKHGETKAKLIDVLMPTHTGLMIKAYAGFSTNLG